MKRFSMCSDCGEDKTALHLCPAPGKHSCWAITHREPGNGHRPFCSLCGHRFTDSEWYDYRMDLL